MSYLRLLVCVGGVYSMFLLWAVAQERLAAPFETLDGQSSHKFKASLFITTSQSFLSAIAALIYLYIRRPTSTSISSALGFPLSQDLTRSYALCALSITLAAPCAFAALGHLSYPALVLAKSCKLVPVLIMNVLVYRRKFALHKYVVVGMVTTGIAIFMWFGDEKKRKSHSSSSTNASPLLGLAYLLLNLTLDGLTNSTQDAIFSRFKSLTGQQMMLSLNIACTLLNLPLLLLPLPYIPVLHEGTPGQAEFSAALEFIQAHKGVGSAILAYGATGALGQLFIFETLAHFGSLTLVTITLTRKMFTMILSVVVYNHALTTGQWAGAVVVFAGIALEAWVKRKDVHAKKVIQEKEKAKLKQL